MEEIKITTIADFYNKLSSADRDTIELTMKGLTKKVVEWNGRKGGEVPQNAYLVISSGVSTIRPISPTEELADGVFSFESWMDKFRTAYRCAAKKAMTDGTLFSDYAFDQYSHFLNRIPCVCNDVSPFTINISDIQRIMPDFDLKAWFDELFEHVELLRQSKKQQYLDELLTTHDDEKLSKLRKHAQLPTEAHFDRGYSISLNIYAEYFN